MSRSLRARLERLERDRPDGPALLTWDELLALCADDGAGGLVPPPGWVDGAPAGRALDWDSLCRSARPPRDPSTIVTHPERRLRELEALPDADPERPAALPP